MIAEQTFRRLRWASRRGMLELDLIMVPFVENRFLELDAHKQKLYVDLLESEDNELFAWFLRKEIHPEAETASLIAEIIEFSRAHKA